MFSRLAASSCECLQSRVREGIGWAENHTPIFYRGAALAAIGAMLLGHGLAHALPRAPSAAWGLLVAFCRRVYDSPLTFTFAALNLGIFVALDPWANPDAVESFWARVSVSPAVVHSGEWWRIFTSGWAHGDWNHVAPNATGIVILGLLLEPAVGSRAFAAIYLASILGSGAATVGLGTGNSAGASGATFGLAGALLVCRAFASPAPALLIWLLAAGNLYSTMSDLESLGIGHSGHLGGLVAGILVGSLFGRTPLPVLRARNRRLLAATAVAASLVVAVGMDPQWAARWQRSQAVWSAPPGAPDASECRWEKLEEMADPDRPVEAELVGEAAEYRIAHEQHRRALGLYQRIARTEGMYAYAHSQIGVLQGWSTPYDDRGAAESLIRSLSLEPHSAWTLGCYAELLLWTDEPSLFDPDRALHYARFAVAADRGRVPATLQTLAWAQFAAGERRNAVRTLRRALDRAPGHVECGKDLVRMARSSPPWTSIEVRDRWYDSRWDS